MDLRIRIAAVTKAACLQAFALLFAFPTAHAGGPPFAPATTASHVGNGSVVVRLPCALPFDTYEDWLSFIRESYLGRGAAFDEVEFRVTHSKANFARLRDGSVECWAMTYRSDGLDIDGFVLQPRQRNIGALPAIVYNRGGNRDFGRLVFADLVELARWSAQGFVVLASQYRGGSQSEGEDEFGGADVDDVLNLFPVARSLGFVDMSNIFMTGFSRGGLMTYLAIARGAPINAAAIIGGPTDLKRLADARPEMLGLYRAMMPDFDQRRTEHLQARSAIGFTDRLDKPLLLIHGGADERVPAEQALAMAQELQRTHGRYELVIYAGDDHALTHNTDDSRRRISDWFRRHLQ